MTAPIRHPAPENKCPICGEKPCCVCRCHMSHSKCMSGHSWYLDSRAERVFDEKDGRWHAVNIYDYWRVE